MVVKDGAREFLFVGDGAFDFACWVVVFKLKMRYTDIRRIYARTKYQDGDKQLQKIMQMYEDTFLPDEVLNAGMLAEAVRNQVMVDKCDILVTYFNNKKLPTPRIVAYEETAAEYAQKSGKRVVNFFR